MRFVGRKRKKKKKKNPHKQGKYFEKEISRSLKWCSNNLPKPFYYQRIHDTRDYVKINPKIQIPHQPADFYAIYDGIIYFLEAKSSRADYRYKTSYVKDNQIKSLKEVSKCGAPGLLLLCNRIPRKNRTWALHVHDFCDLKERAKKDGHKSISWDAINGRGMEIEVRKGKIWDLRPVFTH